MGRTGHLFACEVDDIKPDIICIAKGLGAGYQPIGAMLCTAAIYDEIAMGTGFFQHGHTYLGHPVAAAAGLAVLSEMLSENLINQVYERANFLEATLQSYLGEHPNVGDIRGRGFFRGLEFVADKQTKEPFHTSFKLASKLKKAAFQEGLICYPMPGTRDGKTGDHILLAPPFIATEHELEDAIKRLVAAVETTLRDLKPE